MRTVPVWKKGQPVPVDLESGDYILTFIGDRTLAASTAVSLDLLKGKRLPYLGGHHLTVNRVDLIDMQGSGSQALLSVTCTMEGFPWSGLLVVLTAAFIFLSLLTVERMLKEGPAGALTILLLVGGAVLVAFLVLRPGKAGP